MCFRVIKFQDGSKKESIENKSFVHQNEEVLICLRKEDEMSNGKWFPDFTNVNMKLMEKKPEKIKSNVLLKRISFEISFFYALIIAG